jgi:phospholipid/cholesterol/gamma-HCH transport system substrate-binding protein
MTRLARLGAFIFLTLAVLAAGVFIIGSKQYLFSSTYQVKALFDNVAGLAAGANVQVGGVVSGTVHSISLPDKPGDKITVLVDLEKSTHAIVKEDSIATIETEGLLGNQYLAISFGSNGQPDVKDGETIRSQPPIVMGDLIKKASVILDSSQQTMQNANVATEHIASVTAKIDTGQGTVGALVNNKQLYDNLEQTTSAMQNTMIQAQSGVTDFQENMEALKHNFILSGYFKKRGYEDSSDLTANSISGLPQGAPLKSFTFSAKQLFDSRDSAKLKSQKSLDPGGNFLAQNQFGLAVVVVSAGMEGDTQKDLQLTQARAMVVRQYLVDNFGFDDSQLRTLGMGKQAGSTSDGEWGSVQILVFPPGTEAPADKPAPPKSSSMSDAVQPAKATTVETQKP